MTQWTIHIFTIIFLLLGQRSTGQTNYSTTEIVGLWKSPRDIAVVHFKFDSSGTVARDNYGDISDFHFTGHYSVRKDSIIIVYDTLTTLQRKIYRTQASKIDNDTLLIINKNKIRVNKYLFVYNQDREEVIFKADSTGLLTYKVKDFDDQFLLSQFRFNQWVVIDTLSSPDNDYLDIKNYQLPIHSGTNEFRIIISNKILKRFTVQSVKPIVKLSTKKVTDKIKFSSPTYYELFDSYGKLLMSGTADTIDCSKLTEGHYYINYDTQTAKIKKT